MFKSQFRSKILLVSIILSCLAIISLSSLEWSYRNQGEWIIGGVGERQSPIDIITNEVSANKDLGPLVFHYKDIITSVEDTGHAVQANLSGRASINNRPFKLVQVHFHTPSEHKVNTAQYPMEAHFVHSADDGRIAVIGVFFNIGTENPFFASIMKNFKQNKKNIVNITAPVQEFFPKNLSYYHYLGSLTTPPLVENVEWYILTTPVTISESQLQQLKQFYDNNVHMIQPLAGRPILMKTSSTGVNF